MNREIKFRCWFPTDVDDNDDYCDFKMTYDLAFERYAPINDLLNSLAGILMQYTGLKDKNGKEIYEGDIIRSISFNERKLCTVIFKDGSFVKFNECEFSTSTHGLGFHKDNEVIGNIYENPELITTPKQ